MGSSLNSRKPVVLLRARLDIPSDPETTSQLPSLITVHRSLITFAKSWHRQPRKNPFNDRLAGDRFGLSLITDNDAMPQHIGPNAFHVLGRNVTTAVSQCVSTRAKRKINRCPWRGALTNETFQSTLVHGWLARGPR